MNVDLEIAHLLIEAGNPVFVAPPNPKFDPAVTDRNDPRSKEFWLPGAWQHTMPDLAALDRWRPGWAVCLVTGHGLDGVDVDTKNGADPAAQRKALDALGVTVLGGSLTPSGGGHFYVASTGVCSTNQPVNGVDFRGRGLDGTGSGFLFLPGTHRPKYGGAGYTWATVPDLDLLAEVDVDDQRDALVTYLLGVGVTRPRTRNADDKAPPVAGEPVDLDALPRWLRGLVEDAGPSFTRNDGSTSTDRSERFHHLVGACRRAGLTQGQTVTLLDPWCHVVGKYAGRVEAEVARSWGKVAPPAQQDAHLERGTDRVGPDQQDVAGVTSPAGETTPGPERWVDRKDGLLVADLARDVNRDAPLMRDLGDGVWVYLGGVWRPDRTGYVRAAVTRRLGNKARPTHTTAVTHYLLGQVPVLEPAPVPEFLNVTNGLLDWHTGVLRPHDPQVVSTVQLGTGWDPEATCPRVEAWLAEVLPADLLKPTGDGPGFVWELIGYLCMSGNPLHKAILLLGSGRNGKGTFLRLVTALLGRDNVSAVDLHSLVTNRFRAAELLGKVANIAGDLDSGWLESTAVFKAITGGDTIPAERKYGAPFDFTPWAVPVYSANKVFGTPDTSDGYMSRWVVVPFPNTFLGAEDRTLDHRLQHPDEVAGVLVKAVAGLRAVTARGNFTSPASVTEAFDRFADESDPVRGFMRDVSRPDPAGWVQRDRLWEIYKVWAEDNGHRKPLSRAQLYARAEAAGWTPRKREGVRGFIDRSITVQIVETSPHEKHLETYATQDEDPGQSGAEGAATATPGHAYGGKGGKPAPSAPSAPPACSLCESPMPVARYGGTGVLLCAACERSLTGVTA